MPILAMPRGCLKPKLKLVALLLPIKDRSPTYPHGSGKLQSVNGCVIEEDHFFLDTKVGIRWALNLVLGMRAYAMTSRQSKSGRLDRRLLRISAPVYKECSHPLSSTRASRLGFACF